MSKNKFVNSNVKMLFDQMPGLWGCKDENSIFMYGNAEYARVIGLKHHEELIGLTDFDLPCKLTNFADLFRQQDQHVIQTRLKIRTLEIHPFLGNQWKAFICTKIPLLDEEQNITGTIFHCTNITNSSTIELGTLLLQTLVGGAKNDLPRKNSYFLGNQFSNLKLSQRQTEVLFYLLRGKTVKQIAILFKISHRTVDDYLQQLKHKFHAQNRHELIDKAISLGYLNTIPDRLFNQQMSITLKD